MEPGTLLSGSAAEYEEEDIEPPSTSAAPLLDTPEYFDHTTPPAIVIPVQPTARITSGVSLENKTANPGQRFRRMVFPGVKANEWNDWRWQLRNRFSDAASLRRFLQLSDEEEQAVSRHEDLLPLSITPYYASLLSPDDSRQPLRRSVIPVPTERIHSEGEAGDPLHEDDMSPVPGLIHRYPDRVLFLVSEICAVYCRYCTRSRMVGHAAARETRESRYDRWRRAIDYIESHPEIRDVLISGGDPLLLDDDSLEWLLSSLRAIQHVEFLRIGTKAPVVLPQRITSGLVKVLRKHHPLWMSIHFTHPDELTPETTQACARLADAGIPLGSQTVLLKGINDNLDTMRRLMQGLLKIRVRPYYLYQCDPITGSSHFRTSVRTGLEIIQGLRGFTTGYAVPQFVIDAPGGGGKIPLMPNYTVGYDENGALLLRNYEGDIYQYPEQARE